MARTSVPSAHTLPDGLRVRLRLPHGSDLPRLAALVDGLQRRPDELEAGRLLRFDPRRRLVLCATAWIGGSETLVGYGAIDLLPDAAPDVLLADEVAAPHVAELLAGVLRAERTVRLRRVA
jgi:hypothetical protein